MMPRTIALTMLAVVAAQAGYAQVSYPPVDTSSFATTAQVAQVVATTPQYVNSGAFQTVSALLTGSPCASVMLGRLARVSDVYGSVSSTLVCETDGNTFYWRPQRTDYSIVSNQTSGSMTLTPLLTAPVVYLSATPTSTVTVNLSTANAWPGATFRIYAPAGISLNGINLSGLVGGGTVPLLQGADRVVTYTSSGWKSN